MAIIRYLDEDGNMVESLTRDERIALWNYCYMNVRCLDRTVDCRLMELGMFESYKSSLNSDSDINDGSDKDYSFSFIFPESKKIMATCNIEPNDVR